MALKTLVTVKRVEDPESKIRVKPDGSGIITDGVNYKMNPFDEIAVEEGLRLREAHGVLVRHDGPLDPMVVSAILVKVVELEKPDLVLLGKQSIDDDQNQAGQYLAARLGLPQGTFASKTESLESEAEQKKAPGLKLAADGKRLEVVREVDGGVETLDLPLPAVVTCDLRLNKPRFASLPGIMKAKKKELKELQAAALGLDLTPKVVVKKLAEPPARKGGLKVADVEELWKKLHEEAKVV
jgi:electron transfer flavoprotein beta subunit